MPKIFIDGQEHTALDSLTPTTVGDLLAEIITALAGSHKMIREVSLDGIPLTETSLPEASQRKTAAVAAVSLRTMTYRELARVGLERADLLLQEVIRGAEQSAVSFRFNPEQEAHRTYAACLEDLQLFMDMLEQVLQLTDTPPHPAFPYLEQLAAVTGQLLSAHRSDDIMVLADLLAYELVSLLKDIQTVLRDFRRTAHAGAALSGDANASEDPA